MGRELVIYFDPFSINENDEYKLYLNDSSVPSASVSLAGELHVMGFHQLIMVMLFLKEMVLCQIL